jgi:hypothetical protein
MSLAWQEDDFDVFDGDREVGRIYRVKETQSVESGSKQNWPVDLRTLGSLTVVT